MKRIRLGLPVANFSYSQCDNDKTLAQAAQQVMEDLLHAAGADEVITIQRYAHLVGGARMAVDEQHGVVDASNRSFAIPNLYITDGSALPTQGSANPALTIMAVAARAADLLAAGASVLPRWAYLLPLTSLALPLTSTGAGPSRWRPLRRCCAAVSSTGRACGGEPRRRSGCRRPPAPARTRPNAIRR